MEIRKMKQNKQTKLLKKVIKITKNNITIELKM